MSVEISFNIITQRANRRGSLKSVKERVHKIDLFMSTYNARNAAPFVWTATPDSILEKLARRCEAISGTQR